jgi:hypothetical protein
MRGPLRVIGPCITIKSEEERPGRLDFNDVPPPPLNQQPKKANQKGNPGEKSHA